MKIVYLPTTGDEKAAKKAACSVKQVKLADDKNICAPPYKVKQAKDGSKTPVRLHNCN
ncbi:MAG: hypothetical protein ACSLEL_01175 [Candidatus Malihini olakiniferum]